MPHNSTKFVRVSAGQVEVACATCGRPMFVAPSRVRYFRRLYCDRSCKARDRIPAGDRFWSKVDKSPNGCWLWVGSLSSAGYGTFNLGRRGDGYALAHRYSYESVRGNVPDGLVLDHLCRNRACVNPDHMEPVTNRENILRGQAPSALVHHSGRCARGHERTEENTYWHKSGTGWNCRQCRREDRARQQRDRKAVHAADR